MAASVPGRCRGGEKRWGWESGQRGGACAPVAGRCSPRGGAIRGPRGWPSRWHTETSQRFSTNYNLCMNHNTRRCHRRRSERVRTVYTDGGSPPFFSRSVRRSVRTPRPALARHGSRVSRSQMPGHGPQRMCGRTRNPPCRSQRGGVLPPSSAPPTPAAQRFARVPLRCLFLHVPAGTVNEVPVNGLPT